MTTVDRQRDPASARLIGFCALLAFVAFLLWLWFTPQAAHGQVQQVIVTGGCCCASPDTDPADSIHAGAMPAHSSTPPSLAAPSSGQAGLRGAAAVPAIIPTQPVAFVSPANVSADGWDRAPYAITAAAGDFAPPPRIAVSEPPGWVLFVFGLAAVLGFGWLTRRRHTDGTDNGDNV